MELIETFLAMRAKLERTIASRLGNAAAAADVVQDLYLRLDRVSQRLASEDEAQRYLMRMAINASIDQVRIDARRAELLAGAVDLFDTPEQTPEEAVLLDDQMSAVDKALAELPGKSREMLYLSRVEGLTHAEIAQRMGVSRSLVEKYLVAAVLHCRARLSDVPRD